MRSILFVILFIAAFANVANSQPKIQQTSIRAPADIKIDGNTTEWNNQFQAYNKATNIYYTIANDDKNLYLAIRATDPTIIYKIINGGITLTINNTGKKETSNEVKVTYPLFGMKNLPMINLKDKPVLVKNSSANMAARIDSFKNALNAQLEKNSKEIKVSGISAITDPSVSVYNEYGMRAGERFDSQIAYTYELALPVKYLGSAGIDAAHVHYNIKINGRISSLPANTRIVYTNATPADMGALYATDFWGEYSLAKK